MQLKIFFEDLKIFLSNTANDERIPARDKKVLMAMVALILSPVDIIPDILDYFFSVLDQAILLSHYPWGMKSFARLKKIARFTSIFVPNLIKDRIWKYTREPF